VATAAAPLRSAPLHAAIAALGRLAEVFQRRREQLAASVGLTEAQWRVLDEISSERFMPSLFARSHESTPAAVSKVLRQLFDRGLIEVGVAEHDRRQRRYQLTPRGRRVIARLDASRARAVRAVWTGFDAAELRRFGELSGKLAVRLEAYAARVERERA
jgi:DNA-binding MarR family transcriptional regulator